MPLSTVKLPVADDVDALTVNVGEAVKSACVLVWETPKLLAPLEPNELPETVHVGV